MIYYQCMFVCLDKTIASSAERFRCSYISLRSLPLRSSAQIIVCSYMSVEALVVANRNGYAVRPCVPFDALNPPVAKVLWLFYLSKVRAVVILQWIPFVVHRP